MVAIDLTIILQWFVYPEFLLMQLNLKDAVAHSTTPGIESMKAFKATVSMLMTSSLAAARPTLVSTF